uniref:Uncharacterized protein n=1 Tax=Setaria viridis TaxID=4556 RepID=A0A4U6UCL2_SETVI|nr:hypothetical protein SEVIR_5G110350v2 [Setaria viridis]
MTMAGGWLEIQVYIPVTACEPNKASHLFHC